MIYMCLGKPTFAPPQLRFFPALPLEQVVPVFGRLLSDCPSNTLFSRQLMCDDPGFVPAGSECHKLQDVCLRQDSATVTVYGNVV